MKDIAIIIVNYNMRDSILACLKSLRKDIFESGLDVSVVVIDNNSSDNLDRIIKNQFPEVVFIKNQRNLGFGAANNIGVQSVSAKYYFILNPDTKFIQPKTLLRLHNWMEKNKKVGMVSPKLVYEDGALQYNCFRFPKFADKPMRQLKLEKIHPIKKRVDKFLMKDFEHLDTRPVDWVLGSAMFARGDVFHKIGGFDDQYFMYFEDCDLCRRFWKNNSPVYYLHDVVVQHLHQRGSAKVKGLVRSLLLNRLAREHLKSWWRYYKIWGRKASR